MHRLLFRSAPAGQSGPDPANTMHLQICKSAKNVADVLANLCISPNFMFDGQLATGSNGLGDKLGDIER